MAAGRREFGRRLSRDIAGRPVPSERADPVVLANRITDLHQVLVGITGAPGSGKSTLAEDLVQELADRGLRAVCVGMDGWHLAQTELDRLGLADIKGAPETFDAAGYLAFLRRLRTQLEPGPGCHQATTLYAPRFNRHIENAIAQAIAVPPEVDIVITEGNYLLLPTDPWQQIRQVLDETWYLDPPEAVRVQRLVARHVTFGRTPQEAHERVSIGTDGNNARLISTTRASADLILIT